MYECINICHDNFSSVDEEEFRSIIRTIDPSYYMLVAVLLASNPADVRSMRGNDDSANEDALFNLFTEWRARESDVRTGLAVRLRHIGLNTQAECLLGSKRTQGSKNLITDLIYITLTQT